MEESMVLLECEQGDEVRSFTSKAGNLVTFSRCWITLPGSRRAVPVEVPSQVAVGEYQFPVAELVGYNGGQLRIDWYALVERLPQFRKAAGGGVVGVKSKSGGSD